MSDQYTYIGANAKELLQLLKNEIDKMCRENLINRILLSTNFEDSTEVHWTMYNQRDVHWSHTQAIIYFRYTPLRNELVVYHEFYYGGSKITLGFPLNHWYVLRNVLVCFRRWVMIAMTEPLNTRMERFMAQCHSSHTASPFIESIHYSS